MSTITGRFYFAFSLVVIGVLPGCNNSKQSINGAEIELLAANDQKLGIPRPGEWRYEKREDRQTFDLYKKSNPVKINSTKSSLYLQPIGNFSPWQDSIIRFTAAYLQIFFGFKTEILPVIPDTIVPATARRSGVTILVGDTSDVSDMKNEQLRTGAILDYLEKSIPRGGIAIIGITEKDLYPNEDWNFVFGQARTKNRVAVSSIYRYASHSLDSANYQQCLERLIKTSTHEVGHMFGCQHCTYRLCLMNGSNSLSESDARPNRLCSECLQKLHWNLGFSISDRLQQLLVFYDRHSLETDFELTKNDLKLLSK